jgi:hypothetical protein
MSIDVSEEAVERLAYSVGLDRDGMYAKKVSAKAIAAKVKP